MWLFTTKGFVSAVEWRTPDPTDERNGMIVLRARDRAQLTELLRRLEAPRPKVQETPGRDYRFKAWIFRDQFKELLSALADDITYTNFKNAVFDEQGDSPYERALHRVWGIMGRLQPGGPYSGKAKLLKGKTATCEDCGRTAPTAQMTMWYGRVVCLSVAQCRAPKLPVG